VVPKRFDPDALSESAHRTFDTLANTYKFFALYANLENWRPSAADPPVEKRSILDRWIASRTAELIASVRADLDVYEGTRAARSIGDFVVDDLSNWYVRRSRDRFWGSTNGDDTRAAFRTLYETLVTVARLLAPMTPFHPDWLHRALTGESVHLARYPDAGPRDAQLLHGMEAVRVLSRLGRAARTRINVKVRQPLRTLYAVVPRGVKLNESLLEVARDELNVKEVRFLQAAEELVTFSGTPNFRVLGKRFGSRTQQAAQKIRELETAALQSFRAGQALAIALDGESFDLTAEEVEVREHARGELVVESDAGYTVALDPAIDEELRLEGLARELVNRIQRLRRESGLAVSDRIRLGVFGGADLQQAVASHRAYITGETLAVELVTGTDIPIGTSFAVLQDVELDGTPARIALEVVRKE
jgi:isoleucyl-tRNA synthetase